MKTSKATLGISSPKKSDHTNLQQSPGHTALTLISLTGNRSGHYEERESEWAAEAGLHSCSRQAPYATTQEGGWEGCEQEGYMEGEDGRYHSLDNPHISHIIPAGKRQLLTESPHHRPTVTQDFMFPEFFPVSEPRSRGKIY